MRCLEFMLLLPGGAELKPDVIMFNWGLHDGPLKNITQPGQYGLPSVYAAQLETITAQTQALQPQAKLLFALTSPYIRIPAHAASSSSTCLQIPAVDPFCKSGSCALPRRTAA